MRRQKRRGMAAALCASAVFVSLGMGIAAWRMQNGHALTIEVVPPGVPVQAAAVHAADAPTVLIYHTHTWEAYEMTDDAVYTPTETWRTKDDAHNMVRVGEALADELRARGFVVTHEKTAFEPPNLSAAYTRSLTMLEKRLAAGECYDYIFDVHRDAYSGLVDGANSVMQDGTPVAYVMMLVGKGTGETGSGFDERPDWPKNLELAQAITDAMNGEVSGVAKAVKIKSGRFNQHVSQAALLIEVGNNRNTLSEALAACPVIAEGIAAVHEARAEP